VLTLPGNPARAMIDRPVWNWIPWAPSSGSRSSWFFRPSTVFFGPGALLKPDDPMVSASPGVQAEVSDCFFGMVYIPRVPKTYGRIARK